MPNFQQCVPFTMLLLFLSASSYGQANRTWVSGVGDDANPCSRTAPCKTFAGAIGKTAAAGEINVLDPGGYGAVTITKSISIESQGVIAGVLTTGNGIVVNAGPNDVVVLRGLTINGVNSPGAYDGISFVGGKVLKIDDCHIAEFGRRGINIAPTLNSVQVFITNTRVAAALANGIYVAPANGFKAQVTLDNVAIVQNMDYGLTAKSGSSIVVRNSTIADNGLVSGYANVRADGTSAAASIYLDNVLLSGSTTGIVSNSGADVRLSNCSIINNLAGITSAGGSIMSFGNNRVANVGGNAFTGNLSLQ
jgi:hypothetical protein